MKKQLIEPRDHASETFSEEINSHFARPLTPFEHEIKESYEDLRARRRQTNAPYGYMIGFIYAPHQELKIRICSDARDFETQIFAKFSIVPNIALRSPIKLTVRGSPGIYCGDAPGRSAKELPRPRAVRGETPRSRP